MKNQKAKCSYRSKKAGVILTCPSKEAIQAPICTSGPSLPRARPPPTEPMLPKI